MNDLTIYSAGNTNIVESSNTLYAWQSMTLAWHEELDRLVRNGDLSKTSNLTYRQGQRKFTEWWVAGNTGDVSRHIIENWRGALMADGKSNNTIAVWFAGLRHFLQWGEKENYFAKDYSAGIKRPKRTATKQRHLRKSLTRDEMARVITSPTLSTRDKAIIKLLAYTGARGVEVQRAKIEDLDTINGDLVLYVQGKGDQINDTDRRYVVIAHKDAKNALYAYLAERKTKTGWLFASESKRNMGGQLDMSSLRKIVKGAFTKSGIVDKRKTTHSLRHTAATIARANGASLDDLQQMMGHSSRDTTEIYAKVGNRIENAAERFIDYSEKENT